MKNSMNRLTDSELQMYEDFMLKFRVCWACRWNGKPWRDWMVNTLQNAHIVGGAARRADRRCIARLCAGCHRLSHGDVIKVDGVRLPNLTLGNLLWLKRKHDPEYYDLDFLCELKMVKFLADPEELPEWFN
jgi:hypothetical protein